MKLETLFAAAGSSRLVILGALLVIILLAGGMVFLWFRSQRSSDIAKARTEELATDASILTSQLEEARRREATLQAQVGGTSGKVLAGAPDPMASAYPDVADRIANAFAMPAPFVLRMPPPPPPPPQPPKVEEVMDAEAADADADVASLPPPPPPPPTQDSLPANE